MLFKQQTPVERTGWMLLQEAHCLSGGLFEARIKCQTDGQRPCCVCPVGLCKRRGCTRSRHTTQIIFIGEGQKSWRFMSVMWPRTLWIKACIQPQRTEIKIRLMSIWAQYCIYSVWVCEGVCEREREIDQHRWEFQSVHDENLTRFPCTEKRGGETTNITCSSQTHL